MYSNQILPFALLITSIDFKHAAAMAPGRQPGKGFPKAFPWQIDPCRGAAYRVQGRDIGLRV